MDTTVLIPWSFDPPHRGHMDVVKQAAYWDQHWDQKKINQFDQYHIGIPFNGEKKSLFHHKERVNFWKQYLMEMNNTIWKKKETPLIHILDDAIDWLTVDYMFQHGIVDQIKWVRDAKDIEYENTINHYNKRLYPQINTHFIYSHPDYLHLSSSALKNLFSIGWHLTRWIEDDVSFQVKHAMEIRQTNKYLLWVTGIPWSGKTYVAKQIVEMMNILRIPATHVEFDKIGHQVINNSSVYSHTHKKIISLFGNGIVDQQGKIVQEKLAKVFWCADQKTQQSYNELIGQAMMVELRQELYTKWTKEWLIVIDGALLADHELWFLVNNQMMLVDVDQKTQQKRLLTRANYTQSKIDAMNNAQLSTNEKKEKINKSIKDNNYGTLTEITNSWQDRDNDSSENKIREAVESVDYDGSLRFQWLWKRLWLQGDSKIAHREIYFHYLTSNHAYHNRPHINYGLKSIYRLRKKLKNPDLVELARWFHDIIYNPWASDNKQKSADFAMKRMKLWWLPLSKRIVVYDFIMSTDYTNDWTPYDSDAHFIKEIDYSIFWSPRNQYTSYLEWIRSEYSGYWLQQYKSWRKSFLWKILQQAKQWTLFTLSEFKQYNNQSVDNIYYELWLLDDTNQHTNA